MSFTLNEPENLGLVVAVVVPVAIPVVACACSRAAAAAVRALWPLLLLPLLWLSPPCRLRRRCRPVVRRLGWLSPVLWLLYPVCLLNRRRRCRRPLGRYLLIETIQALGGRAVDIEPPVADEVLLVEEGSVGAEERVLEEAAVAVVGAHVEGLTVGLSVGVIT